MAQAIDWSVLLNPLLIHIHKIDRLHISLTPQRSIVISKNGKPSAEPLGFSKMDALNLARGFSAMEALPVDRGFSDSLVSAKGISKNGGPKIFKDGGLPRA